MFKITNRRIKKHKIWRPKSISVSTIPVSETAVVQEPEKQEEQKAVETEPETIEQESKTEVKEEQEKPVKKSKKKKTEEK